MIMTNKLERMYIMVSIMKGYCSSSLNKEMK